MQLSERIDKFETASLKVKTTTVAIREAERMLGEQKQGLEEAKADLQNVEGQLRDFFDRFGPLAKAPATFRRQPE
jgi:hypothetical protein